MGRQLAFDGPVAHKTWPPPVGTLLILTDAHGSRVKQAWSDGDVLVVVCDRDKESPRVTRVRDHGANEYWMFDDCCRPLEENEDDQA